MRFEELLEALRRLPRGAHLTGAAARQILDVTVTLVTAGKMEDDLKPRFYVTGEVPRPGPYVIRTKTTVLQAIALAGGLGPFAAKGRIQVRREVNGVETLLLFDYRAFEAGTNLENNVELRANDVIIVPERRLFE